MAGLPGRIQARRQIMEEIQTLADPIEEVRKMAENLAKDKSESDIQVEDEVVNIDGVKLEIRNPSSKA